MRTSGTLLHITSLYSNFGIGDLGPGAKAFVDFLQKSKQTYWQMLPLSPIEKSQFYSPYSSHSSIAGNVWLISPEALKEEGLLSDTDLRNNRTKKAGQVDYGMVEKSKGKIFAIAYNNFLKFRKGTLYRQFEIYCEQQSGWLDDYALYVALKEAHGGAPWFQWEDPLKRREVRALNNARESYAESIRKTKWLQFIFQRQWNLLKKYCAEHDIKLFGDLPFYISYDSVDVWSHPDLFALDENLQPSVVAGVPPDYFNANGQLWGMPVFKWDALKAQNFNWWIERLKRNTSMFDMVRLDHFRAFVDYWQVPAKEKTAKKGSWQPGPGREFFEIVKNKLGHLPFVAEDLGDITDSVYALRDEFLFPGMKVAQFAFSDDIGKSPHAPHQYNINFIAYTGTHDNNTIRGWFRKDLNQKNKALVSAYLGTKITERNVHTQLIREVYKSVADTVIIPMQDWLGLDEKGRINTPASVKNNWSWRMTEKDLSASLVKTIRQLNEVYGREPKR
jgi:4-alpha-glucanotransferase